MTNKSKMKFFLFFLLMGISLGAYSQNTFPQTGNVGIGTTNPTSRLTIDGNVNGWLISSKATVTKEGELNGIKLLSGYPGDTNKWAGLAAIAGDLHSNRTELALYAGASEKLRIASNGNVGIGTASPTSKLTINENINGWLISSKATVTKEGEINGIKLMSGYPDDTNKWAGIAATAGDLHSNRTELAFYSSASEKMRIAGNGNVGIGTTSPQAKLAVEGNIIAKEIKVTTNIAVPDYVFEPDYKMLSLPAIENYVKTHKHLPDIPSAKEIGENGLDVAAMNLLLLKKVEELTLHLIEKDKVIDQQQDVLTGVLQRLERLESK